MKEKIFMQLLTNQMEINFMQNASQIYRLHGFIPNPCIICYFIGSYCLNMNVVHYLDTEVMCTSFGSKQHEYTYNIYV